MNFIMQVLQAFFALCAAIIRIAYYPIDVLSLFLPFMPPSAKARRWGRVLAWSLRILTLVGLLVFLWWLNTKIPAAQLIRAPSAAMSQYWLPILGLLMYVLLWLAYWLWLVLHRGEDASDFPDIDAAWEEAVREISKAGIDPCEPPLFLILGKPAGGEDVLFSEAQLQLKVAVPKDAAAPLHVYANRDGIYVTCAGASLLGKQAAILTGEQSSGASLPAPASSERAEPVGDIFKTLQPQGRLRDVQAVLARARAQGRSPEQLTDEEKAEIRQLVSQDDTEQAPTTNQPRPLWLRESAQMKLGTARLKHLCRLIVRDRHPYCPVNGILLLIPFGAADTREDADQTGAIAQLDLSNIRDVCQTNCPVFALVTDLETAPGFREFTSRFPAEQRQRRVGQRFPLFPDVAENESQGEWIERSVQWIFTELFAIWIYKLFRTETADQSFEEAIRGNIQLYQMLGQLRDRRKRFSGIVLRSVTGAGQEPWLFGGCYVAGCGADVRERAFVPGVFRRLLENQSCVAWTAEGVQAEARYKRLTQVAYAAMGVCGAALIGVGWIWFYNRG